MKKVKTHISGFILLLLTGYSIAQTGAKYLVIAHDNFTEAIRPLVEWKTKKGTPAVCVPLSQTGSTATQIKSYIQNAYNTWNPRPEYLLFIGSGNLLPSYYSSAVGGYTDNYYANVTGDYRAELPYGRFPCNNLAQCSLMVRKTLAYEKEPTLSDSSWMVKGVGIVREDNDPIDDTIYWNNIRFLCQLMGQAGFLVIDSFSSQRGNSATDVINAINDGRNCVLYRGQGVSNWWSPFAVNPGLTNNGTKLPVIASVTCQTMTMAPGESMVGERWLRVGSVASPKGAVAFFGNTHTTSNIAAVRAAGTRGFYRNYFSNVCQLGKALIAAKESIYVRYSNQAEYEGFNLNGDPELNLWTKIPKALTVNHDAMVLPQPTNYQVWVGYQGSPVQQALVCVMMDTTVYTFGYTDITGWVTLSFTPQHTGTLQITVTAHNYLPYEGTATVASHDVGITQIIKPSGTIDSTGPITPQAKVRSYSPNPETFSVTFKIGTSYTQTRSKTLGAGIEDTVNFPAWTPTQGTHVTRCSTYLVGDVNPTNDTLSGSVTVQIKDVGVTEIVKPSGTVDSTGSIIPLARVRNNGANTETFNATFKIGTSYNQTRSKTLAAGIEDTVHFPAWTPVRGNYVTRCSTYLLGDPNRTNDTLSGLVTVRVRDIGITQIITPSGTIDSSSVVIPQARVKNSGTIPMSFPVIFRISTFYIDTVDVNNLNPGDSTIVDFNSWLALQTGSHTIKCSTALNEDQNHSNDWRTGSVTVIPLINRVDVWIPDTSGRPGDTVAVPIIVDNVLPNSVYAAEIALSFNGIILTAESLYTGNVTQGWLLESQIYPDSVTIAMAGVTPLADNGVLVWISFVVSETASPGETTTIHIYQCSLNEGEVPTRTQDGLFTVIPGFSFSISGYSKYYWPPYRAVANTEIFLTSGRIDTILTDANGYYIFNGLPGSLNYTVTPRKINPQQLTTISSYDAALILRHVAGQITLDSLQRIAGDVSGNGSLSSYDAALVLRYIVNLIHHFPVGYRPGSDSVDWAFRPASRSYTPLQANQNNQNYVSILYGDVSGNWSPSAEILALKPSADDFIWGCNLPKSARELEYETDLGEKISPRVQPKSPMDELFVFPIKASNAKDVIASDIIITYNPNEITIKDVTLGSSTADYLIAWGTSNGVLKIGLAGVNSLNGDAELAKVFYRIKGETKQSLPIEINSIILNEEPVITTTSDEGATGNNDKLPEQHFLLSNQPNPFKSHTLIQYSLPIIGKATLRIYDVNGALIKTISNGIQNPGYYTSLWDGTNEQNQKVKSGIYFYELKTKNYLVRNKMTVLK